MDNTIHRIVLSDGTEIEAVLNGNNYITQSNVKEEAVTISNTVKMSIDGEDMEMMRCTNIWKDEEGTHLIFHPLSGNEIALMELESRMEYIAMMADVDEYV